MSYSSQEVQCLRLIQVPDLHSTKCQSAFQRKEIKLRAFRTAKVSREGSERSPDFCSCLSKSMSEVISDLSQSASQVVNCTFCRKLCTFLVDNVIHIAQCSCRWRWLSWMFVMWKTLRFSIPSSWREFSSKRPTAIWTVLCASAHLSSFTGSFQSPGVAKFYERPSLPLDLNVGFESHTAQEDQTSLEPVLEALRVSQVPLKDVEIEDS